MIKHILRSLAAVCCLVVATSCSSNLKPLTAENFVCNPSPLVCEGGQVNATVAVTYPKKYFAKKATLTITPVIVYQGGETKGDPIVYQGEKVLGNDQKVSYKYGGNEQFRISIPYTPAMRTSKLCLDLKATTGKKIYSLPRVTIADGIIATETMATAEGTAPAYGYDRFVKDTFDKYIATMIYQYQSTTLRSSESGKQEMRDVEAAIAATKDDERREFEGIDMVSTASPEGSYQLNERLASGREKSSAAYLQRMLKKARMAGEITPEQIAEDWEGFKQLVEESNIQDKQLILSVLSRISDPDQREREIRNLSSAYQELADEILPQLRYSKVTATIKNIGHTDEEILALWKNDRQALTLEETLYAATLMDGFAEKGEVFEEATKRFPDDMRAQNNLATLYYKMGDYDEAEKIWRQIIAKQPANPQANMNLGLIALRDGDKATAEAYIGNGGLCAEYGDAMGTLLTRQGKYKQAIDYFGDSQTVNAAVANVCAGNLSTAKTILDGIAEKDAAAYYMLAVVAARTGDKTAVQTNLRNAVQNDVAMRSLAKSDLEFARYQDIIAGL